MLPVERPSTLAPGIGTRRVTVRMQGKVDSRAMRGMNRSILLDMIRRSGRVSRTELARRSALTKPTVSAIVEELIAEGVVKEVGLGASVPTGGRRARLLEFNACSAAYLGMSFGAYSTRVVVADARGVVLGSRRVNACCGDPTKSVEAALELVEGLLVETQVPRQRLQGAGVAVGGLVDCRSGTCLQAPELGWNDFPLRRILQERLGFPVTVSDLADAAALAEGRLGIAQGCRNYVWLHLGARLAAGIVIDGQVFSGHRGLSGELGECCIGERGPTLDALASGRALVERLRARASERKEYAEALDASPSGIKGLVLLASGGDLFCRELVARVGACLGIGVSYLINLMNPELIVVGGGLAGAGAHLLEALRASVADHALMPEAVHIVPSELGERAAPAGAVLAAMEHAAQSYRIVAAAPVVNDPAG